MIFSFLYLKFSFLFCVYSSNENNRFNSKNGRRRGHRGTRGSVRGNNNYTTSQEGDFFKVTIPNTNRFESNYIINLLKENLDDNSGIVFYNVSICVSSFRSIFFNQVFLHSLFFSLEKRKDVLFFMLKDLIRLIH